MAKFKMVIDYDDKIYSLVRVNNNNTSCNECGAQNDLWCDDMMDVMGYGCSVMATKLGVRSIMWRRH